MKTYFPKQLDSNEADWVVVDAAGQKVGRVATRIASLLKGKHKVDYTPNQLCGDFVIVINAEKVVFSGNKLDDKVYTRYSGYPGGLKTINARSLLDAKPERVIESAVKGMLPKNTLGRKMRTRLKIYVGDNHPHEAQEPQVVGVN